MKKVLFLALFCLSACSESKEPVMEPPIIYQPAPTVPGYIPPHFESPEYYKKHIHNDAN